MKISGFEWNKKREIAAFSLATGETQKEAAEMAGVSEKTIYNWLTNAEFSAEVDRLSLMIDIASKAERLRLARRVVRFNHGRQSRKWDNLFHFSKKPLLLGDLALGQIIQFGKGHLLHGRLR